LSVRADVTTKASGWRPAVRLPRLEVVRALIRRDYSVSRSYRVSFVLDVFFGVVTLLIYFFISRTFEDATTRDLGGAPSYFAFAAVGVALNLVIQSATARLIQRVREEQLTGALEILVAQPVTTTELALGMAGFHFVFAVLRAVFYLLIAGFFLKADLSDADWGGFAAMLLATAVAMACIGIALSALVLVIKRADLPAALILLALALLGGAFFPVTVLPGWLQPVTEVLPTTLAFSGVRAALYRGEGWSADALELALLSVVALPLAIAIFRAALWFARRDGSLSSA
jgi:ABC-2 type transport system permease protein